MENRPPWCLPACLPPQTQSTVTAGPPGWGALGQAELAQVWQELPLLPFPPALMLHIHYLAPHACPGPRITSGSQRALGERLQSE